MSASNSESTGHRNYPAAKQLNTGVVKNFCATGSRPQWSRPRPATSGVPGGLLICAILLTFANAGTLAFSSSRMQEPSAADTGFWGVITSDNVPLRCSPSEVFYIVGKMQSGDVVYVTKIDYDSGWAKINAPYGTPGFAFARDFELQPDGNWAVAPALCYGRYPDRDDPKLSWKRYVIEAGTTVRVLEEITTDDAGYLRIEMPEYVPVSVVASFIRPATDEEVAAHRERLAERKARKLVDPGKETPPAVSSDPVTPTVSAEAEGPIEGAAVNDSAPVTDPVVTIVPEVSDGEPEAAENAISSDAATDTTATNTPSSVVEQPAETPTTAELAEGPVDTDTSETAEREEARPAPVADSTSVQEPVLSIPPSKPLTFEELEVLYENLKTVPILEAEIAPIRAGFNALANDESQSAGDRRRARARVKLLEIRQAHQDSRRRIEAALAEADDSILNALIESDNLAREAGQATALVGKLTLSNVYDGNRLPLRYRLRDRITGRTLAYVPPVEKVKLASFLDENVIITGARVIDPALNVTVIQLKRIVRLEDESKSTNVEEKVNFAGN